MNHAHLPAPPTVAVPLKAGLRRAVLRMATVGESHVFVADPSLGRGQAAQELADQLQVLDTIDTLDGEAMTMDFAREIAADAHACAQVLLARADWLAHWRDAGAAHARCPHCGNESRWTLRALADLQGAERLSLADTQGRLRPFALSWPPQRGARPAGPARASGIRFELPSRAAADQPAGGEGIIKPIDPLSEIAAWERFAPIGLDPPEERDDWTFESAGFRAVLRGSLALASLDDKPRAEITPADIEPWPLGDFCFLDELYALAFETPASAATPAPCGSCGQPFLPLG